MFLTRLINSIKEKFMEPTKEEIAKMSRVERYQYYRKEMEKYFVPENVTKETSVPSPSGKYRLVMESYATKKGAWNYSRGRVYAGEKLIADVKRNYGHFPYAWAEGHPNGHDYMLCGEDYQGYTVIELDTGARNDLLPDSIPRKYSYKEKDGTVKTGVVDVYPNGYGFCWASIDPSPDRMVLAVSGCFWACPYEVVLFDFSEPMALPLWELERWDDCEDFESWETQGKLLLSRTIDARRSDKKPIDDLPEEEVPENDADWDTVKLTKVWEPAMLKASRSSVARKEYERLHKTLMELGTQHEAADVVRDLMDRPWFAMTEEDQNACRKLDTSKDASDEVRA